jgi:hypothetical protein
MESYLKNRNGSSENDFYRIYEVLRTGFEERDNVVALICIGSGTEVSLTADRQTSPHMVARKHKKSQVELSSLQPYFENPCNQITSAKLCGR